MRQLLCHFKQCSAHPVSCCPFKCPPAEYAQSGQACRLARRADRPGAQAGQARRQARRPGRPGTQPRQGRRQARRTDTPSAQAAQAPRQARRPGRPSVQAGQAPRQARHSGRPGAQVDQAPRQASRPRTENDGEMAAKTIRFVDFAASGAAGSHFGRAACAPRLQKAI